MNNEYQEEQMGSREESIRRMRARHSMSTRAAEMAERDGRIVSQAWLSSDVAFREICEHDERVDLNDDWTQCVYCRWALPNLGDPPDLLRLPPIMDRALPSLDPADLHHLYANAGVVLNSMCRLRVVQQAWQLKVGDRKCGIEVKFKLGWREAGVVEEHDLYRVLPVLQRAERGKPKTLWRSVQGALGLDWKPPWEAT